MTTAEAVNDSSSREESVIIARDVGHRIVLTREHLVMTQDALATALNVPKRSFQSYERGERLPSVEFLVPLARNFNIDPIWLLTGEGEMLRPPKHSLDEDVWLDAQDIADEELKRRGRKKERREFNRYALDIYNFMSGPWARHPEFDQRFKALLARF